ncbi:MAG: low molecular weight protein arginine phosphatase [Firmicutes bacterium]|nr:low molecular weight protein arginine phosphatase [Bacillota bacterium]
MKSVLFVCTGNTCRSSMAEALLRNILKDKGLDSKVQVSSAGVSALPSMPASPEAVEVLAKGWQLDISSHKATQLTDELVSGADLILTMSKSHQDYILQVVPEAKEKVFLLSEFAGQNGDVSDPIGRGREEYQRVAEEIEGYLQKALPKMIDFLGLKEGAE